MSLGAFGLLLRKIAVGFYLALARQLTASDLMRALVRAGREFRRGYRRAPDIA